MSVEYELPIKTSNRMQKKRKCHPHHHGLVDRGWDRMSVEYEPPISSQPSEGKHGLALLCDDDQVEDKGDDVDDRIEDVDALPNCNNDIYKQQNIFLP